MEPDKQVWSFADAILDERAFELRVGGQPVKLERKYFEALTVLLKHAGEVVTRDELLAAVWPGRVVTEAVLNKCIWKLRDVLGDKDQSIIKTVHGVGFRLIAPVSSDAAPGHSPRVTSATRSSSPVVLALVAALVAVGSAAIILHQKVETMQDRNRFESAALVAETLVGPAPPAPGPSGDAAAIRRVVEWHLAAGYKTIEICHQYECTEADLADHRARLARLNARVERYEEATQLYDEALLAQVEWDQARKMAIRLEYVLALIADGRVARARSELLEVSRAEIDGLDPYDVRRGNYYRVEGLLAAHGGRTEEARLHLEAALGVFSRFYSMKLEETAVRADLARLQRTAEPAT